MASRNRQLVPEARAGLNKFKMEAAQEVGVNLKDGYNGDLTSRQNGSVGGQMTKENGRSYTKKIYNLNFNLVKRYMLCIYLLILFLPKFNVYIFIY